MAKVFTTKLGPERIVEQIDDVPVPQVVEDLLEAVEITSGAHLGAHSRTVRRELRRAHSPNFQEETLEVVHFFPAQRISERMGVGITPLERISERIQIVDVPVPQTLEETAEAMDVPVPQFRDGNC